MVKFLLMTLFLFVVPDLFAQSTNQTMTKIVVRYISTNYPSDSFAAQPIILYRSGEKYSRTEEAVDLAAGIHGLSIVSEPDAWMINLIPKTGIHTLDGGPTYVCHDPIVPPPGKSGAELKAFESSEISKFEFGTELEFLKAHKAKKDAANYEIVVDGYKIKMSTKGKIEAPFQLTIFKGESQISFLQYDEYKTGLPFDPSLFLPPAGIQISERN